MAIINVKSGMTTVNGTVGNDEINLKESVGNGIVINGNAGNDVITVTRGNNHIINAGAGADFVTVATGKNYKINLGEGNDRVDLLGAEGHQVVAVAGTNNINVNNGSSYIITGGSGIDRLTIKGTNSNIKADLGAGEDVLGMATGSGNEVHGGEGKDYFIVSGGDTSTFYGDEGNDTLRLYRGESHVVHAGSGDDSMLVTEANNSKVYGDSGKNQIMFFGGTGNEYYGGDEKDNITLKNKAEAVKVIGGSKATVVNVQVGNSHVIDLSKSTNTVTQIMAGSGTKLTGSNGRDTLSVWGTTKELQAELGNGNDFLNVKGGTNMELKTGAGKDEIRITGGTNNIYYGEDGDDTITVNTPGGIQAHNVIFAGAGNDYLHVSGEGNDIYADEGDDEVVIGNYCKNTYVGLGEGKNILANDLTAGTEFDISGLTVDGMYGVNDIYLLCGTENSTVRGGDFGDNILLGGIETGLHNKVMGMDGNDTIYVNNNRYAIIDGGAGWDNITCNNLTYGVISGGQYIDTIELINSKGCYVDGATAGDYTPDVGNYIRLSGTGSENIIFSGYGPDTIHIEGEQTQSLIMTCDNCNTIEVTGEGSHYNSIYGGIFEDTFRVKAGYNNTFYAVLNRNKFYIEGGSHNLFRGGNIPDKDEGVGSDMFYVSEGIKDYNMLVGREGTDTYAFYSTARLLIDAKTDSDEFVDALRLVQTDIENCDIKYDLKHEIVKINNVYIHGTRYWIQNASSLEDNGKWLSYSGYDFLTKRKGAKAADLLDEYNNIALQMGDKGYAVGLEDISKNLEMTSSGITDYISTIISACGKEL